ncbi:hypothetical protein, partial [Epibacterium ulvae]|uniref:hypothetical protein n=1 Tax=Epibacterium ulvae TaxID=1156985 RepID=UPI0024901151
PKVKHSPQALFTSAMLASVSFTLGLAPGASISRCSNPDLPRYPTGFKQIIYHPICATKPSGEVENSFETNSVKSVLSLVRLKSAE